MKLKNFQIDAFTDRIFSGNPARVCTLDAWLDDTLMQRIAMKKQLGRNGIQAILN